MKKTDRKNKTGQIVNWPTGLFTIEECHINNPEFVNITLRSRIDAAISTGIINILAYLHNGKGRPRQVMVFGSITQDHIAEAKSQAMVLKNDLIVNVMNISIVPKTTTQKTEIVTSTQKVSSTETVCH